MWDWILFVQVKPHLILHRCHKISFISPVDGVRMWPVAAAVIPFGSRAVLQKAAYEITTPEKNPKQADTLFKISPVWVTSPVAQTRGKTS